VSDTRPLIHAAGEDCPGPRLRSISNSQEACIAFTLKINGIPMRSMSRATSRFCGCCATCRKASWTSCRLRGSRGAPVVFACASLTASASAASRVGKPACQNLYRVSRHPLRRFSVEGSGPLGTRCVRAGRHPPRTTGRAGTLCAGARLERVRRLFSSTRVSERVQAASARPKWEPTREPLRRIPDPVAATAS
jgi:hypothetical protein